MEDKSKASSASPTVFTDHQIPFKEESAVKKNQEEEIEMNPVKEAEVQLQLEMEKRRMKEEMIACEILRRKELEAQNETTPLEKNGGGQDVALGRWPFQRDPACVAAQFAGKSLTESSVDQEEVVQASSGNPGMKRKAEAMENTSDQGMPSRESKDSQKKWYCSLCGVSTTSEGSLNHHFQGKKHKAKEANARAHDTTSSMSIDGYSTESSQQLSEQEKTEGPNKWRCSLCQVSVSSEMHLRIHLQGKKHKANEAKLGLEQNVSNMDCSSIENSQENIQPDNSEDVKTEASKKWYCPLCKVSALSEKNLNDHFQGKKHKAKSAEKVLELAELTKDKSPKTNLETNITTTKSVKCEEQETTCDAVMEKIESESKSSSGLEETSDKKRGGIQSDKRK